MDNQRPCLEVVNNSLYELDDLYLFPTKLLGGK